MDKKTESPPVLPKLYHLGNTFKVISNAIFLMGLVFCLKITISGPDIPFLPGQPQNLLGGIFILLCGSLADPYAVGVMHAARDPFRYFSSTPSKEEGDARYNPTGLALHAVVTGLIATVTMVLLPSQNIFFDITFCTAYVIAAACFVLLVCYKKKIV